PLPAAGRDGQTRPAHPLAAGATLGGRCGRGGRTAAAGQGQPRVRQPGAVPPVPDCGLGGGQAPCIPVMTGAAPTASAAGLRPSSHRGLGGQGDGMQVIRHGGALYVGHTGTTGAGTSVLDVTDPSRPVLVTQWPAPPRSHTHKVQVADGLLLVNHEKFPYRAADSGPVSAGLPVYPLPDP